jgi:hypothetical protein
MLCYKKKKKELVARDVTIPMPPIPISQYRIGIITSLWGWL